MKLKIILFFLIAVAFSNVSCEKKEEKTSEQNDLVAVAEITSDRKVDLKINEVIDIGLLDLVEETKTVDPGQNVVLSLKTDIPVLCFMLADKSPVIFFLQPGKKIEIKLSGQEGQIKATFSDDDHINHFTDEFHKVLMPLMTDKSGKEEILKKIDQARVKMLQKLEAIKPKTDSVSYDVLKAMVNGKMDHIKFMQSERFKDLTPESPFFDFTDHYNFNNDYFLTYSDNLNTVIGVLNTQYERQFSKPLETSPDMIGFVNRSINSEHLKSQVLSFLLSRKIPQMSNIEKEELIKKLKGVKIGDKYLHYLSGMEAGTALGRKTGNPIKYLGSLKAYDKNISEEQLKGKLIYIDNWATWCGPCVKSIKSFNKKQKELKQTDDIVYIFVSFDRKESIWKNFIEKNSFEAKNVIHLFNGSNMNSDYARYYNISELPFYMVADRDGKIKDLDPKEPLDDEYIEYIKQLIRK